MTLTVTRNEERNGIELRFSGKPNTQVRDLLKEQSFRWSRAQRIWYARFSEIRLSFATTLSEMIATADDSTVSEPIVPRVRYRQRRYDHPDYSYDYGGDY